VRSFYVYILASQSRALYVGYTNNLRRRLLEHREKVHGFAARYRMTRLVYFECCITLGRAMNRERQLKGWRRQKKIALIESKNPTWRDLWQDDFGILRPRSRAQD
jgi:putative endonuclease